MMGHPAAPGRQLSATAGFTLIEVLVALGIVAVTLLAGLKATGALSYNAGRQTLAILGQICAENELVRLRLQRQLPGTGSSQSECLQGGQQLMVTLQVQATPNPNFRRVDALVNHEGHPVLQLSTIMGRN